MCSISRASLMRSLGFGTILAVLSVAAADEPVKLPPGKWVMFEWLAPTKPRREITLMVGEKDGKPTVTAVDGESFQWTVSDISIVGRRVRMKLTQEGPPEKRF